MAQWSYQRYADNYIMSWESVKRTRKPAIAAVSGYALGGGCELAMMRHDHRRRHHEFGQPEITIGTIPGMGGTQRLPRAVGKAKAMDWCLTGRMIDAARPSAPDLARVVPSDKLFDETLAIATKIASYSLPTILKIKESINRAYESSLADGLLFERRGSIHLALDDQKEGRRSSKSAARLQAQIAGAARVPTRIRADRRMQCVEY